ncbi:MAG TPA: carbohydrate ABC transporter permease [Acidimicrobiales bacterium]|nr:carbohydrate ABC transporter permease [Acidimicrobiales bacterium]
MATSDVKSQGAAELAMGQSPARKNAGLVGQYLTLGLLSLLVLGPIGLTVIQALSPPFRYVSAGRPLHPVEVSWQDRTWFSGGPLSLVVRTLIVFALLAWLQKVASGGGWKDKAYLVPSRIVAIVGGTVALALVMNPLFQSFFKADGNTAVLYAAAVVAVAATQVWAYLSPARSPITSVVMALFTGFGLISFCIVTMGPTVWTLAWTRYDLGPAMGRSFVMTICVTVLQVSTAIMAAYAFVFLRFPFKRILFALFMATLLLPLEVTLVGNVATIRQLDWTDTMKALVLPFGAAALGTFLIRQGFRGLPTEIQDATRLDGYGHVAFLTRFAVPLTRPVIAAFTVISALSAWNQYLWPRSITESNSFNTLQIQLRLAAASEVPNANQAIAAALVAAVPVVLLLIAFQRQIIRGLTAGAVK